MHFGRAVGFASDAAPRGPPEPIRATIDAADPLYTLLRARFQQRPIWSRGALKASLPADPLRSEDKLRFLLPQLGYYFSSGPWRNCWRRERLEARAASLHGVARA